jgi:hypothetical protein
LEEQVVVKLAGHLARAARSSSISSRRGWLTGGWPPMPAVDVSPAAAKVSSLPDFAQLDVVSAWPAVLLDPQFRKGSKTLTAVLTASSTWQHALNSRPWPASGASGVAQRTIQNPLIRVLDSHIS